jgi:centromere protein V
MTYRGGCHCGQIAFEVDGELTSAIDCNCSICAKSGFIHWRIEPAQLRLLTPWDKISTYIWGTGQARHYFCPTCGVAPLRVPRRSPNQYTVNVRCLEGVDLSKLTLEPFNGRALEVP